MPELSHRTLPRSGPSARLGCLLIAGLSALAPAAVAAEPSGIAWRSDFATAQAEARARNLPLWVQFTGPWCIFCRKMDANAFVDPAVIGPRPRALRRREGPVRRARGADRPVRHHRACPRR